VLPIRRILESDNDESGATLAGLDCIPSENNQLRARSGAPPTVGEETKIADKWNICRKDKSSVGRLGSLRDRR
jgi:hypothetical protein